jgi:hypothetical protein
METGSHMTAHTTIQSHQTADFQVESKRAVSAGIFAGVFLLFRSPMTFAVLSGRFQPPVSASKNSVPRGGVCSRLGRSGTRESQAVFGAKTDLSNRSALIAGSSRGLRTVGSIQPEHHEVAPLQHRVASDLRPQRARGLGRGTLARSSC